jgi:hypothetical protein
MNVLRSHISDYHGTEFLTVTQCINANYVLIVGHVKVSSCLFHCIVSVL